MKTIIKCNNYRWEEKLIKGAMELVLCSSSDHLGRIFISIHIQLCKFYMFWLGKTSYIYIKITQPFSLWENLSSIKKTISFNLFRKTWTFCYLKRAWTRDRKRFSFHLKFCLFRYSSLFLLCGLWQLFSKRDFLWQQKAQ